MGGMGEVYLTHDLRLNERVAVKTVRAHLTADPAVRSRFIAEIQNARRVTHPNVCRIFDLFDEGEIPCFSMEYIEGTCLAHWLGSQAPERAAARRIALDLAEGLHAAHRNGIVHGDFKPGTLILALPISWRTGLGAKRRSVQRLAALPSIWPKASTPPTAMASSTETSSRAT